MRRGATKRSGAEPSVPNERRETISGVYQRASAADFVEKLERFRTRLRAAKTRQHVMYLVRTFAHVLDDTVSSAESLREEIAQHCPRLVSRLERARRARNALRAEAALLCEEGNGLSPLERVRSQAMMMTNALIQLDQQELALLFEAHWNDVPELD